MLYGIYIDLLFCVKLCELFVEQGRNDEKSYFIHILFFRLYKKSSKFYEILYTWVKPNKAFFY